MGKCRLCLRKGSNFIPIADDAELKEKILNALGFHVKDTDDFNSACHSCVSILDKWFTYKRLVLKNQVEIAEYCKKRENKSNRITPKDCGMKHGEMNENGYYCSTCNRQFRGRQNFASHLRSSGHVCIDQPKASKSKTATAQLEKCETKTFTCTQEGCRMQISDKKIFETHMKFIHKINVQNENNSSEEILVRESSSKKQKYSKQGKFCCNTTFTSLKVYKHHLSKHHRDLHYCECCDVTVNVKLYVNNHIRKHKNLQPHQRVCYMCFEIFDGHKSLLHHQMEMHYYCDVCRMMFQKEKCRDEHVRLAHSSADYERSKKYRSDDDGDVADDVEIDRNGSITPESVNNWKQHNLRRKEKKLPPLSENPFKCSFCRRDCETYTGLKAHQCWRVKALRRETLRMALEKGGNGYECMFCQNVFGETLSLSQHQCRELMMRGLTFWEAVGEDKRLKEEEEKVAGEERERKKKNLELEKSEESSQDEQEGEDGKDYICGLCNKRYFSKLLLRMHKCKGKLFECEKNCGRCFQMVWQLKKHKKKCTGKTIFNCDLCGKHYETWNSLWSHVSRYCLHGRSGGSGVRVSDVDVEEDEGSDGENDDNRCRLCNRKYSSELLQMHKCRGKPFECNKNCGHRFQTAGQLMEHEGDCKGEMLYKCDCCGKRCFSLKVLKKHLKQCVSSELNVPKEVVGIEVDRGSGLNKEEMKLDTTKESVKRKLQTSSDASKTKKSRLGNDADEDSDKEWEEGNKLNNSGKNECGNCGEIFAIRLDYCKHEAQCKQFEYIVEKDSSTWQCRICNLKYSKLKTMVSHKHTVHERRKKCGDRVKGKQKKDDKRNEKNVSKKKEMTESEEVVGDNRSQKYAIEGEDGIVSIQEGSRVQEDAVTNNREEEDDDVIIVENEMILKVEEEEEDECDLDEHVTQQGMNEPTEDPLAGVAPEPIIPNLAPLPLMPLVTILPPPKMTKPCQIGGGQFENDVIAEKLPTASAIPVPQIARIRVIKFPCDSSMSSKSDQIQTNKETNLTKSVLTRRVRLHCDICNLEMRTKEEVEYHKKTYHKISEAVVMKGGVCCNLCSQDFRMKEECNAHKVKYHKIPLFYLREKEAQNHWKPDKSYN